MLISARNIAEFLLVYFSHKKDPPTKRVFLWFLPCARRDPHNKDHPCTGMILVMGCAGHPVGDFAKSGGCGRMASGI